jgi:hypothetical protein
MCRTELGGRTRSVKVLGCLAVSAVSGSQYSAFLDTAHYLVTKHSQESRLMAPVAVTARVYSSRALGHRIIRRRPRYLPAGYRFKPIGGHIRRPCATNGVSTLRGDEESACAHKLVRRAVIDERKLLNVSRIIPGDWGKAESGWLAWPLLRLYRTVRRAEAGFTSSSGSVRALSVTRKRNLAARSD